MKVCVSQSPDATQRKAALALALALFVLQKNYSNEVVDLKPLLNS